jgi:proline racemase
VAIQPGKVDRPPTGTAVSARMALMAAKGEVTVGDTFTARLIIGSSFSGRIVAETHIGERAAIVSEISDRGWVTGRHPHMFDPDNPSPEGCRLRDIWGV